MRMWTGAIAAVALVGSTGAHAQACQEDFKKLTEKRMSGIEALNTLGKAGKGKMDPEAACPAAKRLVAIETEMTRPHHRSPAPRSLPTTPMA